MASMEVAMDYDAGDVIIPRGGWSHIIARHTLLHVTPTALISILATN